jgi:hypothetical protein
MEINLNKIKINTLWSVGALIALLLLTDLILRIYLNYHQIKYYRSQNGGSKMDRHGI